MCYKCQIVYIQSLHVISLHKIQQTEHRIFISHRSNFSSLRIARQEKSQAHNSENNKCLNVLKHCDFHWAEPDAY